MSGRFRFSGGVKATGMTTPTASRWDSTPRALSRRSAGANKDELPELQVHILPHSTAGLKDAELAKKTLDVSIGNVVLKLVSQEK